VGGVAVLGVVERHESLVLGSETVDAGEAFRAGKALVPHVVESSTTPLRHGSRCGMNLGITSRSKQTATTGPKCCQAGGIAPPKLDALSNWATAGIPTRPHIAMTASAIRFGRVAARISDAAVCEPMSIRFNAWSSTPPSR
jgi:hypothetical protein